MVLLYDRLLIRSYRNLYKITDTKTGYVNYVNKSTFDNITRIICNNENEKYYVKNINNKISEININTLKFDIHIKSFQDINTVCKKYNILKSIYINKHNNPKPIPSKIKSIINNINNSLHKKCKELSIIVDNGYKINTLFKDYSLSQPIICLYYKDQCISTISYSIYDNNLVIASDTLETYRNNKYNSLLRAIAVIISKYYNVNHLVSNAINPISVYTLSKYFVVTYDNNFTKFLNNQLLTFDLCKKYMENNDIDVYVSIDNENIQRAIHVYDTLFSDDGKLKCP